MNLQEKAELHAKKMWGIYIDDVDEDCNDTRGNLTIKDYKAGYNQALKDRKHDKMLDMLKKIVSIESIICMGGAVGEEWIGEAESLNTMMNDVKQLIKEATEL